MGKAWARGDYCTLAPDKLFGKDLSGICFVHDVQYMDQKISKKEADIQLRENIKALGLPIVAWIYYIFVRLVGGFFWK